MGKTKLERDKGLKKNWCVHGCGKCVVNLGIKVQKTQKVIFVCQRCHKRWYGLAHLNEKLREKGLK